LLSFANLLARRHLIKQSALLFFIFGMRNKTKQKQTILIRGCLSIEVASLVIALISQSFLARRPLFLLFRLLFWKKKKKEEFDEDFRIA
jgi:hypothetical protein